jgi:hypothetical protein
VMEVAKFGAVFKFGCSSSGVQVRVVKLVYSSWGVHVGVCRSGVVNSWFPGVDGMIFRKYLHL